MIPLKLLPVLNVTTRDEVLDQLAIQDIRDNSITLIPSLPRSDSLASLAWLSCAADAARFQISTLQKAPRDHPAGAFFVRGRQEDFTL